MMKRVPALATIGLAAPILLAAALAACSAGAGGENNRIVRQDAPPAPGPGAPCFGPISDEGLARCVFGPRERLRGVWVTGFERSEFVPGGNGAMAPGDAPAPRDWLAFAPGVTPDPAVRAEADALRGTVAIEIAFEGRRARRPGRVTVVDRIISMRVLGPTR